MENTWYEVEWQQKELLTLETLDGQRIDAVQGRFRRVGALAIAPDLTKVAFEATSGAGAQRISGLHYAAFGSKDMHLVDREPRVNGDYKASGSLGWSPDSTRIVYERGNKIRLYDLRTRESIIIGEGTFPTWSPSGDWIAYRSLDDQGMIMTPNGDGAMPLMRGRKILGFLHWSPDSQYLLFSEAAKWEPFNASRLVVLRLRDRVAVTVMNFGFKGGRDNGYDWIYDYKSFCSTCLRF